MSTFELLFCRQNRTFLLFNWEAIVVFSWFFLAAPKLLHDNTGENSNCLYSCQISWKQPAKGQLILKADWRAIDSPKKRTDEFVLFAFLLFTANKSNSYIQFLGESMARQSAIGFIRPLELVFVAEQWIWKLQKIQQCAMTGLSGCYKVDRLWAIKLIIPLGYLYIVG